MRPQPYSSLGLEGLLSPAVAPLHSSKFSGSKFSASYKNLENWSRDCRRCHIPAFEDAGSHDRDFIYGYDQHFKAYKASEKKRLYSGVTK